MKSFLVACTLLFTVPSFAQLVSWQSSANFEYAYSFDFNTRTKKAAVIARNTSFYVDIKNGRGDFTFVDNDFGDEFKYKIDTCVSADYPDGTNCIKMLGLIKENASVIYIFRPSGGAGKAISRIGIASAKTNQGVMFYNSGD